MADNKTPDAATISTRRNEFMSSMGLNDSLFSGETFDMAAAKEAHLSGLWNNSFAPKVSETTTAAKAEESKRFQQGIAAQLGLQGDEAAKFSEADLFAKIAELKTEKSGATTADKAAIDKELFELKAMLTASQNEAKGYKTQIDGIPAQYAKMQSELQQQLLMHSEIAKLPTDIQTIADYAAKARGAVLVPTDGGKYYIAERQQDGTLARVKKTESTAFDNFGEYLIHTKAVKAEQLQAQKPTTKGGEKGDYKVSASFAEKIKKATR